MRCQWGTTWDNMQPWIVARRYREFDADRDLGRTKRTAVERLIAEVASMTGETKTEAIRRALEERRDRLTRYPDAAQAGDRLRRVLEREIWPTIPPARFVHAITMAEEEFILGYGNDGL